MLLNIDVSIHLCDLLEITTWQNLNSQEINQNEQSYIR